MANVYTAKKARIIVLEDLDKELDNILNNYARDYTCIKEEVTDEQAKDWRTGELLWEDEKHTIPKMKVDREYGYIDKPQKDLSDEDKAVIAAVADIRKALEKLV